MTETNISGVLVHAQPEKLDTVRAQLIAINGVEVHGVSEEGKMVVTVEEDSGAKIMADKVLGFQDIEGVLSAALVYQFCDDLDSTQEEASV